MEPQGLPCMRSRAIDTASGAGGRRENRCGHDAHPGKGVMRMRFVASRVRSMNPDVPAPVFYVSMEDRRVGKDIG